MPSKHSELCLVWHNYRNKYNVQYMQMLRLSLFIIYLSIYFKKSSVLGWKCMYIFFNYSLPLTFCYAHLFIFMEFAQYK